MHIKFPGIEIIHVIWPVPIKNQELYAGYNQLSIKLQEIYNKLT